MNETALDPDLLRLRVDPGLFDFETTETCAVPEGVATQDRALSAISFGASVRGDGFNIYAMGSRGLGRRAALRSVIEALAAKAEPFDDWVYVNNFEDPHRPRALKLPFGSAIPFRDAMAELIEDLAGAIPAAFESDDYKSRRSAIEAGQEAEQEQRLGELRDRAAKHNIALVRTPLGFAFVPTMNGEIVKPEVFNAWPAEQRHEVQEKVEELQEELASLVQKDLPSLERVTRSKIRELDREVAKATIELAIADVLAKLPQIEPIQTYLTEVSDDLVSHFHLFLALARAGEEIPLAAKLEHPGLRRYAVNVMDATADELQAANGPTAPIIEEPDPNYPNLIGRIEHQPHEGALITDFTMIKPGALHRANGGYLILEARDVLMQPFAWEALKRCLKTSAIRITSAAERFSLISTISLEPDEIPLSLKVALIGDRYLYYLLCALDPDFQTLFKVQADFEDDVHRSDENIQLLAALVAAAAKREDLSPFHRNAVAAVLEESSRIADDAAKLSLRIEAVTDLMREADHWARNAGTDVVAADQVRRAITERRRRADRIRERSVEMVEREIVNIAVTGSAVGEINGLSVISLGDHRFGRPSRITARARMGVGKIIDIEREVKLGGPLHSKGVLILSSFLATRYGGEHPVSLSASIVFEQSYGGVDGDSASSTELYAMLSSLAEVPIKQSLAVTGSVDQFGRVQAIGGVNEKIEGFFDVCKARGLTSGQGVLIPKANVQHLNLRHDVAEAAAAGQFFVHAVDHVDKGIELLTGIPAGDPDVNGKYPEETINGRVAARLATFSRTMRKLMRASAEGAMELGDEAKGDT